MPSVRARLCVAVGLTSLLMAGCAVLEPFQASREHAPFQQQRIDAAMRDLENIREVDLVIRLDNEVLATQIQDELAAVSEHSDALTLADVRLRFDRQYLALECTAWVADPDGTSTELRLFGDVLISLSDDRLLWMPEFHIAKATDTVSVGTEASPAPTEPALEARLDRINSELSRIVTERGNNALEVQPMPLGIVEAGASLMQFDRVVASESGELGGVFTTAGSVYLVEPDATRFALDLEFVPRFTACAGNVDVARSGFVKEIVNREPVGSSGLAAPDEAIRHFYTEIVGAEHPTSVIHYWFADGRPVTVTELPVEPSFRWRTWSSRQAEAGQANRWEVIVVETASGCILESMAVLTVPAALQPASPEDVDVRAAFEHYRDRFAEATRGFTEVNGAGGAVFIEVRREFFGQVLADALQDLQLVSELTSQGRDALGLTAQLTALDAGSISCEGRECTSGRECMVDYDECPVERDTRDCTSCLFRNPLNNRCVNQGQDPICEAARAARNQRLERARQACVEREQDQRDECERLRAQEVRSCEMEVAMERNTCQARKKLIAERLTAGPVAALHGEARVRGPLTVTFSRFELAPDLSRFGMDLGLRANLEYTGKVQFDPGENLGVLRDCIAGWGGDFASRIALPRWETGLTAPVESSAGTLTVRWTGFTHRASMNPPPLQSLFVAHPELLAQCQIGLRIEDLSKSVTGEHAALFSGEYTFSIQPLPTRIQLVPAWLKTGSRVFTADPGLGSGNLVYRSGGGG